MSEILEIFIIVSIADLIHPHFPMGLDVRLVDFDCVLAPPVGSVKLVGGSLHSPAQAESIDVRFSRIHPGIPLKRVPVLRVFGVTRAGQKACIHVHQVWSIGVLSWV